MHVWVPGGLRGACSGHSKSRNLARKHGIAFRRARADQAHGKPPICHILFCDLLLLCTSICQKYRTSLTQARFSSSLASSFSCATSLIRACTCVSLTQGPYSSHSSSIYEQKVLLNFSFFVFAVVSAAEHLGCVTPSSKLCKFWQPWCNSSRMSRYSVCGIHERRIYVCFSVRICVPS